MALIKCKECGKQISSEAESCPNCGRKRPKSTSGLAWAVLILLVIGVWSAISASNKNDEHQAAQAQAQAAKLAAMTPEQRVAQIKHDADMAAMKAEVDEAVNARYACQEFVKKSLNDPDAAQFDAASGYLTKRQAPGQYRVEVTVRAKNGFNALRHIAVNCVTQKSGENWLPVLVKEIT
jgi:RNA polymerase subunit RPABC4/transcription elongation factor Spt4